jgi:23S rRNA pseudouridine2457 synthase
VLIAFNKPYGVVSQFTPAYADRAASARQGSDGSPNRTLAEFGFPKDVYPIGRLDADSEGLLFLSDEPAWNERLLHPRHAHEREYWAQIERIPTAEVLRKLEHGVVVLGRKTLPCRAWILESQPEVGRAVPCAPQVRWGESLSSPDSKNISGSTESRPTKIPPRDPPIRFRKSVPDCWIGLELIEGKNRQVRRMTAAIGHPTLRLIRVRVGNFWVGDLPAGKWRILTEKERTHCSGTL